MSLKHHRETADKFYTELAGDVFRKQRKMAALEENRKEPNTQVKLVPVEDKKQVSLL